MPGSKKLPDIFIAYSYSLISYLAHARRAFSMSLSLVTSASNHMLNRRSKQNIGSNFRLSKVIAKDDLNSIPMMQCTLLSYLTAV